VSLRLANAAGQVVRAIDPPAEGVGPHRGRLDTTGLAAGVYFLDLELGTTRWSRRLTLVP
jgi:hypothetical protein